MAKQLYQAKIGNVSYEQLLETGIAVNFYGCKENEYWIVSSSIEFINQIISTYHARVIVRPEPA